jgi:hypothetical protein
MHVVKLPGAAMTWTLLHNVRKYFDFICSCPMWGPAVTLQMFPAIANASYIRRSISRPSLFAALRWRCCSTCKAADIGGTYTTSFTNLTVSDLRPCNRSHTSNPFSRKQCVEIGTELCVKMWRWKIMIPTLWCRICGSKQFYNIVGTVNMVNRGICVW